MQAECYKCRGRLKCGRSSCPIYARSKSMFKVKDLKEDFDGASPNIFVGRFGYPNVNVGLLAPQRKDDAWLHDAPRHWAGNNYRIDKIIDLRSALVNSRFTSDVRKPGKFLDVSREVSMASKPVEVEVLLKKKPSATTRNIPNVIPMGPAAELKKVDITSNPRIPTKVDKIVSDTDRKAVSGMKYLFKKDFDEQYLTKLLSVGNLGVGNARRLVPTRWAITAVDDTLGKGMINDILDLPHADYQCYFGGHMGNYYVILVFPDVWSYELFESYLPKSLWNQSGKVSFVTDYEDFRGRKEYAHDTAGGYYAARIGILEKFKEMKRQGSVLALRFITEEYYCPLGVWVVREAVRKALSKKPMEFSSEEEMLSYAKRIIQGSFGYDATYMLDRSKLLKEKKEQMKLTRFF